MKRHEPAGGRRGGDACRKINDRQAFIFSGEPNKAFPGPLKKILLSGDFYKKEAAMETEKGGAVRTGSRNGFPEAEEREFYRFLS